MMDDKSVHEERVENFSAHADNDRMEKHRAADAVAQEPSYWTTIFKRGEYTAFYEEALQRYGDDVAIDPVREAQLKRKVDLVILPILAVCYFFYYVSHSLLCISYLRRADRSLRFYRLTKPRSAMRLSSE